MKSSHLKWTMLRVMAEMGALAALMDRGSTFDIGAPRSAGFARTSHEKWKSRQRAGHTPRRKVKTRKSGAFRSVLH